LINLLFPICSYSDFDISTPAWSLLCRVIRGNVTDSTVVVVKQLECWTGAWGRNQCLNPGADQTVVQCWFCQVWQNL